MHMEDEWGFAACTFFGEGCVKIMQIGKECEIKHWLITLVVSIWLQLQHGNHVVPPRKTGANRSSPVKAFCSASLNNTINYLKLSKKKMVKKKSH